MTSSNSTKTVVAKTAAAPFLSCYETIFFPPKLARIGRTLPEKSLLTGNGRDLHAKQPYWRAVFFSLQVRHKIFETTAAALYLLLVTPTAFLLCDRCCWLSSRNRATTGRRRWSRIKTTACHTEAEIVFPFDDHSFLQSTAVRIQNSLLLGKIVALKIIFLFALLQCRMYIRLTTKSLKAKPNKTVNVE